MMGFTFTIFWFWNCLNVYFGKHLIRNYREAWIVIACCSILCTWSQRSCVYQSVAAYGFRYSLLFIVCVWFMNSSYSFLVVCLVYRILSWYAPKNFFNFSLNIVEINEFKITADFDNQPLSIDSKFYFIDTVFMYPGRLKNKYTLHVQSNLLH